ncbi:MAG: ribosomal L7Ae/L30e/S12e/Gadd45 family protein [Clostridia bacterium]|nr:ribosomal L7Ae/L30e/S12e/Gadd45 family protein [Clostridia bacterium]
MTNKVYSFLGLATKAGKVVSGDETCERAIKSGKVFLTLIARDASENTKKKFSDICSYRKVELRFFGEKEMLGRYTGKEIRSVICILEQGFAKRLMEMLDECESGGVRIVESQNI